MAFGSTVTLIVIVISLVSAARRENRGEMHRIARVNEFDNCKDRPIRPYHITDHKIFVASKNVYALNAEGVCSRASQKIERVEVNMTKCSDRTKMKCEHYRRLEWKSSGLICPILKLDNMPWSSFLTSFHPPIRCENAVGKFAIKNMTVDFELLSKMNLAWGEYYLSQWEFSDERWAPWLCFATETDFPLVRKGKRS